MTKTWVITGTSRGIGRELAQLLLARGDTVVATVRKASDGAELERAGARVELLDVADPGSVESFAARLGDLAVDVLVNNSGIYDPRVPFEELTDDHVRQNLEVNTLGPLRVTRALLPNLRRGSAKRVFQLTSKMGSIADNSSGGAYAYRTSKAALNAWTRSFALDFAPEGFVAVVLHPGWVATDMGGKAAPVSPRESAEGLLRLMDAAGPEHAGRFFDFRSEEVPW